VGEPGISLYVAQTRSTAWTCLHVALRRERLRDLQTSDPAILSEGVVLGHVHESVKTAHGNNVPAFWYNNGVRVEVDLAVAVKYDVVCLEITNLVCATRLTELDWWTDLAAECRTPVAACKSLAASF